MANQKNKSAVLLVVGVVIALVVGIILWLGGTYNALVARAAQVDTAWAQIDNNLVRRNDLIPNLVNTVKGYAAHEEELFTEIATARSQLSGAAGNIEAMQAADTALTTGLSRLLAIAEAYPDLKASANFIALQDELAGTENRLTTARKDYNDQATAYNIQVRSIPTNLVAGMFGFTARELYQIADTARAVPVVNFE
jgi:LemA protein